MSKYIERDAAVKAAIYGADDWDGGFNRSREMYIEKAINNVPTVDAVPVVRCIDCVNAFGYITSYGLYGGLVCECMNRDVDENFYCAYGERKKNESDKKGFGN